MAFDFLGTFNETQLSELETYLTEKIQNIQAISNNLIIESNKLKRIKENYETALKKLGGKIDAKGNLITKQMVMVEPIPYRYEYELYERRIYNELAMKPISNTPYFFDDQLESSLMTRMKKPFVEEIKKQREDLEHKIRKIGDRIEQVEEIRALKLIAQTETQALLHDLRAMYTLTVTEKHSSDLTTTA